MTSPKRHLAASVAVRLLNQAKASGDDYQILLTAYAFERFLYRLGQSDLFERFVLKGAMLLRLWSDRPYRATRDLDMLRRGAGSFDAVRADLRAICLWDVAPDGITFDAESVRVEAIRAADEYAGTRARLEARNGKARLSLQIDLGLGDSVWPAPRPCPHSGLLDEPLATGPGTGVRPTRRACPARESGERAR